MRHRPKDMDPEEWRKLWDNSHPQLQPLANLLKEWLKKEPSVRPSDFETPNHYGKLVAELARKQTIEDILALLPDSVEK